MSRAVSEPMTDGDSRWPAVPAPPGNPPLYAVGDIHGHLAELDASLHKAGLVDAAGDWSGDDAAVWFLGDFTDRGPDGIGVLDRVRTLSRQASQTGGKVGALLGNHELLLLGTYRYGDAPVPITYPERSFRMVWMLNGGQQADLDGLTEEHVAWLSQLDVVTLAGQHLLMHSDTTSYLSYGDSVDDINHEVRRVLAADDIEDWWLCFRRLTSRHEFRYEHGGEVASDVLARLGGRQIVHGHSTIPNHLGVDPSSVVEPYRYAGGLALAIDGGVYLGGPCLVVRLDASPDIELDRAPGPAPGANPGSEAGTDPAGGEAGADPGSSAGRELRSDAGTDAGENSGTD